MTQEPVVFDTPDGIQYAQYATVKAALKLEKVGLKSRGGSLRKPWALKLGLKSNATFDVVIAELQRRMDELIQSKRIDGGVP